VNRCPHRRSKLHRHERRPRGDGAKDHRRCSQDDTLASASPAFPCVFGLSVCDSLPLEIGDRIGTAAGEGHDVIFSIAGAGTARPAGRRAWMLALELACDRA
jgi:hypothetical protein